MDKSDQIAEPEPTCFSPKRNTFKYVGLAFMCILAFGPSFCYDDPAALQDNFKDDLNITTRDFVWLYSIYSWPNVVLGFVAGFLIDNVFGIRWGTIIYITLVVIGQLIFAAGCYINVFWLQMVGRFVLGVGGESVYVAQSSYGVLWFTELNFVFGLHLCISRIGSTINFVIMEDIYNFVTDVLGYENTERIGVILCLTSLTCVASWISAVFLGLMDYRSEKVLKRNEDRKKEVVKLSDVKNFNNAYWLITCLSVAYYMTLFPFVAVAKIYFMEKYKLTPGAANTANSLVYFVSAFASPFFGFIMDKTGKIILWSIISLTGTFVAHALLAFTDVTPYVCTSIYGLCTIVASNIWTLVALTIPENQLGTAYGTIHSTMNLGLAITDIFSGIIVDKYGYFMLEIFFLICVCVSLISVIGIWILDWKTTGGYLNMTPGQQKEYKNNPYTLSKTKSDNNTDLESKISQTNL